jgi:putative ribosome biogenesis GTPase RsgA
MAMSLQEKSGVEEVMALLKGKVTLLSGHSGVGKSTFINHLFPANQLKTQEVSGWSGKGMHTTTFAEMFDLQGGGQIIDTPGIREMGLVDISKQELAHYFPEMRRLMNDCQFNNCMHINEPGCAIKNAVNNNSIHTERYVSYLSILLRKNTYTFKNVVMQGKELTFVLEIPVKGFGVIHLVHKNHLQLISQGMCNCIEFRNATIVINHGFGASRFGF